MLALSAEGRSDDGPETGVAPELQDHFAVSGELRVQEEEAQRDLDRAIAESLRVPMGTVLTWRHRARKELTAQLSEHLS